MQRREFITLLGGAASAWPLAARAQQPVMPVIGFLGSGSPELSANLVRAFREGLSETGYVEGRNITIESRWAGGQNDRLPALAADLVRHQVSVIAVLVGTPATLATKAATGTIPIVFAVGTDPVAAGLVASLARPGGNVTGVTNLSTELGPKRLELLRELIPTAKIIALLVNPTSPFITENISKDLQLTARTLGLQLHILNASTERDFDTVFATFAQLRADALVIAPDAMFISRSEQLGALTLQHAVPAITQFREFAAAGGLMSYGGSFTEASRQVGVYAGRILKGEKPAELPVQQHEQVRADDQSQNRQGARHHCAAALLARADEVIE